MTSINTNKITFIGAGNMASSLMGGLLAKGFDPKNITASDPNTEALQNLEHKYNVNTVSNNANAVKQATVVILAVKPQIMSKVCKPLASSLAETKPLIISIAAGIALNSLEKWLSPELSIVRCMPNTPALLQQGATGIFANGQVSDTQKESAKNILDAVGLTLWLNTEKELDAVTAVSGSGPAYFFLLMEAMIKAGIELGLDTETAKDLTLQTALGAAAMALDSTDSPEILRKNVTSPGGTTEQAILSFQQNNFSEIVNKALGAANKRSASLTEELDRN